jgi:hypothetical protein
MLWLFKTPALSAGTYAFQIWSTQLCEHELRIYDKCDWHSAQDEEHVLLDCSHEHLVSLCTQHRQLVFPTQ